MNSPISPYVGLRPFTEEENAIFCGRKRETEALVNRIYASRTVVVFAPSGVGKTSLLRAGVRTELQRDKAVHAVYINDWTKPCLDQVREGLRNFSSNKPSPAGPSDRGTKGSIVSNLLELAKEFRARTGVRLEWPLV